MNRRDMIKRTAIGGTAVVISGSSILMLEGCQTKDVLIYLDTVGGVLEELKPLLPGAAKAISEGIAIVADLSAAYRDGKFDNAMALFANLSTVLSKIAADAGVTNPQVKIALAVAGVAMRAVAVLLKSKSRQPAVAGALKARTSPKAQAQRALIERLADEAAVDQIFAAVKF